jgi:hypothetical protein
MSQVLAGQNSPSAPAADPHPVPTVMTAEVHLHSVTHFAAASALNPVLHHAVDLSRLHHPVVVPDTDEFTHPANRQRWVQVRGCAVSGWSELCDVDPGSSLTSTGPDGRTRIGSPNVPVRWREILPDQFVLLRIRDASWQRSPSGERIVGVHRRQLVPVKTATTAAVAGRNGGVRALLRAACHHQERIMVELIDGTRLVGTAKPAPHSAGLLLLSARRGCAPIPVHTAHITHVGLACTPGNW